MLAISSNARQKQLTKTERTRSSNSSSWRQKQRGAANLDARHGGLLALLALGILVCLANVVYLIHVVEVSPTQPATYTTTRRHPLAITSGKERLLQLLNDAGLHNLSKESIEKLPTWSEVVQLYGDGPKFVGLETCSTFVSTVDPSEALVGPAGPFNSGTNLLATMLVRNCVLPERRRKTGGSGIRNQVNWGKHSPPARMRLQNHVDEHVTNNTVMLPVVAVRDPYSWMQSMCRRRYAAHWFHSAQHCPNLIPNDVDWEFLEKAPNYRNMAEYHHNDTWLVDNVENTANLTRNSKTVPVYVKYKMLTTNHESLAHMWNEWYSEYLEADYPRVFVRMEDLVFYPRNVTETVCHCAGGQLKGDDFVYVTESAKLGGENVHGSDTEKTSLLEAMIRYGSLKNLNKTRGMTHEDVAYARQVLSEDLMKMFGYSHPPPLPNQ